MANSLEKIYSAFGGVDSRSNKLLQNPKTFRKGSKNFRYNFQDEIQKANGFQHKDDASSKHSQGLFPYHFIDVTTGESKIQLLGVDDDGVLNKKRYHQLKATTSLPDMFLPYSFYYDEVADSYVFKIEDKTITVSKTMTLSQLVTAVNAVTAFVTLSVHDESGNAVVGSTQIAYLGDVVVDGEVYTGYFFHQSYFWERVLTPTLSEVCFPTTRDFKDHPEYEGISFINKNNKVYITDGGFPITYDGFAAYRMGMPRTAGSKNGTTSSFDGFSVIQGSIGGAALTTPGTYKYKYQLGFVDPNGQTVLGAVYDSLNITLSGGNNVVTSGIPPIKNTDMFPVFACRVFAQFVLDNTNQTFTVNSGHNIQVGMVLRIPVNNATLGLPGISYWYANVTATTATTITVQAPPNNSLRNPDNASYTVVHDQWINGGFTQDANKNTITDPIERGGTYFLPPILAGAFVRIFRTLVNQDVFYRLYEKEIPLDNGLPSPADKYNWTDDFPDADLSGFTFSANDGGELPRACKYLAIWQDTIIQAGRPVDPTLKNQLYPTTYTTTISSWGATPTYDDFRIYVTEAGLCDFSSIYWADFLNVEGFPISGLFEQFIDTKLNDRIRGMIRDKDAFFVFKDERTSLLTGDLIGENIKVEILESNEGCISHRSIKDIGGTIIWLSENGFQACSAGRLPVAVGWPICDYQIINKEKLNYRKAVAAVYSKETMYFCAVGETTFVYDFSNTEVENRSCWYIWDRIDTKQITDYNGKILLSDGERLWQMKATNTKYDFTDDVNAIEWLILLAWMNKGEPIIDKDWIFCWINSIQGGFSLSVEQYNNYLEKKVADLDNISFVPESDTKVAVKESAKMNREKLSALSIGLRNSAKNAYVRIQGIEVQCAPNYDKNEPKQ